MIIKIRKDIYEEKEWIPFSELAGRQKERPDVFPIFEHIHQIDGELVGEVKGYSDGFGNHINQEESGMKIYH